MKTVLFILIALTLIIGCEQQNHVTASDSIIAAGQIPNLTKDANNNFHLVYGKGDTILYTISTNGGKSFATPQLVGTMSKLFSFAMRGPQIASTESGPCIIACNQQGDIFSFRKNVEGKWTKTSKVTDLDTIAKEGLMALASDGKNNLFAVWLDLRNNKHNNIYGARSEDGGLTWSRNQMIYTSPDGHTCECCKPSVTVNGKNVAVMFRNWINGNRDLYLIQSFDNGRTFGQAVKLGNSSWKLDGCPMDGGGLAINKNGEPQTVWNRKGIIYASEPGKEERQLGKGRNCTVESVNGKNVYAWVENGKVVVLKPQGKEVVVGKGSLPVLKAVNNEHVLCVWQNDKQIHKTVLEL